MIDRHGRNAQDGEWKTEAADAPVISLQAQQRLQRQEAALKAQAEQDQMPVLYQADLDEHRKDPELAHRIERLVQLFIASLLAEDQT